MIAAGLTSCIRVALSLVPFFVVTSASAKIAISPEVYGQWRRLVAPILSDDGRWAAYTLVPGEGTADLVVRSTRGRTEFRATRGPVRAPDSLAEYQALHYPGSELWRTQFSADSRFVVFTTNHGILGSSGESESQRNVISCVPSNLAIMRLADGSVTEVSDVLSFVLPSVPSKFIAYKVSYRIGEKDLGAAGKRLARDSRESSCWCPEMPGKLVIRDLHSGLERHVENVTEYAFTWDARYLVYVVADDVSDNSGVYLHHMESSLTKPLITGFRQYRGLTLSGVGNQLAFLAIREHYGTGIGRFEIFYAPSFEITPERVVKLEALDEMDLDICKSCGMEFAEAGNALIFRVQPRTFKGKENSISKSSSDRTLSAELWRWNDRNLPYVRARHARIVQSYLAVYHIENKQWTQLESGSTGEILVTRDAQHAVAVDESPYELQNTWSAIKTDIHLVDVVTGRQHPLLVGIQPRPVCQPRCRLVTLSPAGQYMIYFAEGKWWSYSFSRKKLIELTDTTLADVFDSPQGSPPGIAGWTAKDHRVIVYGQRDLWELDPSGIAEARNLTYGVGRRENVVFRLWNHFGMALNHPTTVDSADFLPSQSPILDTKTPLLLVALDKDTMASGIWQLTIESNRPPEKMLMLEKRVTPVAVAKLGQQYLFTIQTFSEYPDLWATSDFKRLERISQVNPQQSEYIGAKAELVQFTSDYGAQLKGRLYKPENFNVAKKYPMIVSIYEEHSQLLHVYAYPEPLVAAMSGYRNWADVVSKGYLYFAPDVRSVAPYPGRSAAAAVIPAVKSLIRRGFVDPSRIALTGFSFGAYEVNYLLTQTKLFRCAISGAGVSNTASLYGTRLSSLENGQLRHGASVWEAPFIYIANSPVFHADRISTPLLIQHNKDDTVVPFSQALELFSALRRNGRQAYLLSYPGEWHGIYKYANRMDWNRRVHEFLDYCLQDSSMPDWMAINVADGEPTTKLH